MTSLINHTPLDRFSSNPDIVRHLIQVYLDITPKTIEKIDASVATGDTEQVAWHAHSLKGCSAELGAEQLAKLCQQLQVVAKAGDRESIAVLAKDLARCYTETTAALAALAIG